METMKMDQLNARGIGRLGGISHFIAEEKSQPMCETSKPSFDLTDQEKEVIKSISVTLASYKLSLNDAWRLLEKLNYNVQYAPVDVLQTLIR